MNHNLKDLQNIIGYKFRDESLLESALMHSSYTNEKHIPKYKCNERIEFLGDAVLELVCSEFLYLKNRKTLEGEMTKTRARIVCEPSLAACARDIHLGEFLILGRGEEATGGRERDSVTSDALEALIGAIYLDGGFANAKEFVHKFVFNDLENKALFYDSKTILQELVQKDTDERIRYELIGENGPDHRKTFLVEVYIGNVKYGEGIGKSKKHAEMQAAYNAIKKLRGI